MLPLRAMVALNLSQRIAGQTVWLELVSITPETGVPKGAANVREDTGGDVLASGTTMQWNRPVKSWNAGAVMVDA
ncbi:hypothetical protein [Falsiroseomonas tokyonensis]|uniref:Uncharacterized protein n=1 Tax=Falsiroseomonas tokyonensis TaxID=430521 RepID=A0ABV7BRP3_9PROT|nr:hypothetical protein [Falsiroseomonas tokyonensis]MBU8537321.1 hypothetical protein [Falsiroseomonas tokyonensis]